MTVAHTHTEIQALTGALAIALGAYPDDTDRLLSGFRLALDGLVELHVGEAHIVRSRTEHGTVYAVSKTCTCPDYASGRAPGGRCKHRWGVAMARKAQALLAESAHSTATRDKEASMGHLAAITCTPEWRSRAGGQHAVTNGK
jgi:hypothetical protein